MPNWKKVIVSGSNANLSTLSITNSGSTADSLILTATEDSSTAAPVVSFKRNSSSPLDADYLGQLKFKGENDADQEVVYAKITAKIQDASDGTEDGLIEFANKKAGSNNITARLKSDKLQLINGTELEVDGQVSASSFIGDGSGLTGLVSGTINYVPIYDSSGITESLISQSSYGEENDTQVVIAAQRTVINSQVVTTTYSSPSGDPMRIGSIGNTDEIRITGADIETATDAAKKILTVGQDGHIHTADGNESISGSFSGSFIGDGSGLTGISTTVVSSSTVSDTFTSATTHSVSHTLGTKDLIINVYDSNDDVFIPTRVNTPNTSSVVLYMDPATTGRVVIGKAGHIVSGSSLLDGTGVISGSAQIASNISGSFTSVSASIATDIIAAHTGSFTGSFVGTGASLTGLVSASHAVTSATSSRSVNKNTNSGSICFWQGSSSEYSALGSYDPNTVYFVV